MNPDNTPAPLGRWRYFPGDRVTLDRRYRPGLPSHGAIPDGTGGTVIAACAARNAIDHTDDIPVYTDDIAVWVAWDRRNSRGRQARYWVTSDDLGPDLTAAGLRNTYADAADPTALRDNNEENLVLDGERECDPEITRAAAGLLQRWGYGDRVMLPPDASKLYAGLAPLFEAHIAPHDAALEEAARDALTHAATHWADAVPGAKLHMAATLPDGTSVGFVVREDGTVEA